MRANRSIPGNCSLPTFNWNGKMGATQSAKTLTRSSLRMTLILVLAIGLAVGVLVGLLGIGGGVLLVPAMVYLLHFDQHLAQGTSLFILLPPTGLGALRQYWRAGQVDVRAGICCAIGFLLGGYFGGRVAVPMSSDRLRAIFAFFLLLSAVLLWGKTKRSSSPEPPPPPPPQSVSPFRVLMIVVSAAFCGVAAGMVGIGGGVLLVPLLALLFTFDQHRAQGTSLIALIPPTGLLAFLEYAKGGYVSWRTGLLLIPGVFLGGIAGGQIARKLDPVVMRQLFAAMLGGLGFWQLFSLWHP